VVGTLGNPSEADACAGSNAVCAKLNAGAASASVTASAAVTNRFGSLEAGPIAARLMIFSIVTTSP
jgi:hypothetical protein